MPVAAAAPAVSTVAPELAQARARLALWTEELGSLEKTDALGVGELQSRVRAWIGDGGNQPAVEAWMAAVGSELARNNLRPMFLMAGEVVRAASHPEPLVDALLVSNLGAQPPATEEQIGSKLSVMTIYALEQYLARLATMPEAERAQARQTLLPNLLKVAEESPDLAVVRGAVKVLNRLEPQPQQYWSSIRGARKEAELFAIADLISG